MSSKPKAKDGAASFVSSPVDAVVWIALAVAALATVYFLLREPEDGIALQLDARMIQARRVALAAAVIGTLPGIWRVFRTADDRNLFAMAVLFNLMIACYWILRLTLV